MIPKRTRIIIIGAGWYGVHTALYLKEKHPEYDIIILEKQPDIFKGISGTFGIRLHVGPHYPRSIKTRKDCHKGVKKFMETYPELINDDHTSLYLLGKKDAHGCPSKVDRPTFKKVCEEFAFREEIDPNQFGFKNVSYGAIVNEPTAKLNEPLRDYFRNRLLNLQITTCFGILVTDIRKTKDGIVVVGESKEGKIDIKCDSIINATSYQSLLLKRLPLHIKITYQPCLALLYRYIGEGTPLIFIIMDGAFPCLMPYADEENSKLYILTHGLWTILGSYSSAALAQEKLDKVNDQFVEAVVKRNCETEVKRFYESFFEQYEYMGWKGTVLAKPAVGNEFRSALTFKDGDNIYITPGKITNIFDVAEEIDALLTMDSNMIIEEENITFLKNGILARSRRELTEYNLDERSTARLQPYSDLLVSDKHDGDNQDCVPISLRKSKQDLTFLVSHQSCKSLRRTTKEKEIIYKISQIVKLLQMGSRVFRSNLKYLPILSNRMLKSREHDTININRNV